MSEVPAIIHTHIKDIEEIFITILFSFFMFEFIQSYIEKVLLTASPLLL